MYQRPLNFKKARSEVKTLNYIEQHIFTLEEFLPPSLRLPTSKDVQGSANVRDILTVLGKAQADRRGSINLLSHMVLAYGRSRAALHLVDMIVKDVVATHSEPDKHPPSTVLWPVKLSSNALKQPVMLERPPEPQVVSVHGFEGQDDALTGRPAPGLGFIWRFLGSLVIEAANLGQEGAAQAMSVVYQTLAKLHHLNMIPDNIYNLGNLPYSAAVQRPPILHLLSSRILTTISDATWRSYQDEAISRGADLGISYRETQNPPGGRFRLKVRELGPEIWLEFILWCCVESNCPHAGSNIVSLLSKQTTHPWFAVNWTASGGIQNGVHIDWDRVKMRTGGTVGRIEGYSDDKPLAEVPARTISVEVVLALVESSIDIAGDADAIHSKFSDMAPRTVQTLIGFLEPHSLSEEYFDYLSARLVGSISSNAFKRPLALQSSVDALIQVRSLERSERVQQAPVGMNFRSIVQQSELYAGILHLTLHALSCTGQVQKAISVFDRIQSMVDNSKMASIASFINTPPEAREGFFNAAPMSGDEEFTMSHGQVPYSRLAVFLDLLTENDIVPLAEWLVYSTDADGPRLPGPSFQRPSVASALVRFAGAVDDPQLLQYVLGAMRVRKLKPPVSLLRSLANAQMQCLNFPAAHACLRALKPSIAGGYHPDNLACIAHCILRLEAKAVLEGDPAITDNYLKDAISLMEGMLKGHFEGNPGDFYIVQRQLFKQQIGHILRICENVASPTLNRVAHLYKGNFMQRNSPNLPPRTFNIFLRGIVETAGPDEGIRMWELFCKRSIDGRYPTIMESIQSEIDGVTALHGELDAAEDEEDGMVETGEPLTTAQVSIITDQPTGKNDVVVIGSETPKENPSDHEETQAPPATTFGQDVMWDEGDLNAPFKDFVTISDPADDIGAKTEQQIRGQPTAYDPFEDESLSPVVVPNVQTLRIIANKIIDEATTKEDSPYRHSARTLLKSSWVKDQFSAFGLESERSEALSLKQGEFQQGSVMMPQERVGVRAPDFVFPRASRRGTVLRVSDLFAREDDRGWVSRLPRRVNMRTGDGQRRTHGARKYFREEWDRLGWLYDRMAGEEGDGQGDKEYDEDDEFQYDEEQGEGRNR